MPRPRQCAIKHRALAMCRCGCRCHADRQRHTQTSRNGDIKQSPRPAGSQADLSSAAGPCEAARFTSDSWIGVERHQIHLPLLRWTEPARCHHHLGTATPRWVWWPYKVQNGGHRSSGGGYFAHRRDGRTGLGIKASGGRKWSRHWAMVVRCCMPIP